MKKLILIAFAALCFSGCVFVNILGNIGDAIQGEGDLQSYEIMAGSYNKIRVSNFCEVRYYASSSNFVTLEVQPNLREYFVVEVVDNELIVRTTRNINTSKIPVLTVYTPVLESLNISGMCYFTAFEKITGNSLTVEMSGFGRIKAEVDIERLYVNLSGTGGIEFSGRALNADFWVSGAGELDALQLQTQAATVNLAGVGSIGLNCLENLTINASGTGSVSYTGSPVINQRTSGVVSVRKLD